MNHEKQRIAIAKAIGWRIKKIGHSTLVYAPGKSEGHGYHGVDLDHPKIVKLLPDFPNDLNAMHEAEEWLRGKQIPVMGGHPCLDAWRWYQNALMAECPDLETFHAKAEQRARAFLKLWKLWEEAPAILDSENS
jgi:hypothetical protein